MAPAKEEVLAQVRVARVSGHRSRSKPKVALYAEGPIKAGDIIGYPAGSLVSPRRLWSRKKTAKFPVSCSHF